MLNAKQLPYSGGNSKITVLEPGTYPARLVNIVLLGVQAQREYKGETKPPVLEIMLTYELLDEFMKDEDGNDIEDKPRWVSERIPFYNLNSERAKSTKRYYALDSAGEHDGDWSKLVGTPCMITVTISEGHGKNAGKKYENVANVSAMRPREAAKAPDLVNPAKVFDFYSPDLEVFNSLPEWVQNKIKEAVDFDGSDLQALLNGGKPAERKALSAVEQFEEDEIW
jgi:hypothetical protein